MAYSASRGGVTVDQRLVDILKQAARSTGIRMSFTSGVAGRASGTQNHPNGRAIDIQLYDANGRPLPNLADPRSFPTYEKFAQAARAYQRQRYPELDNLFAWGGYFGPTKGNKSGFDLMHFDVSGNRGRMGNWETGLNEEGRRLLQQPSSAPRQTAAGAPASNIAAPPSSFNPAQHAYDFYVKNGLTPAEAAAVVGNFAVESGNWQYIHRFGDTDGQSFGVGQWRGPRLSNPQKTGLFDRFGRNPTYDQQLQFALDEYNTIYKPRMQLFGRGSQDVNALSDEWRRVFEGAVDTHQPQRAAYADQYFRGNFGNLQYSPTSAQQTAASAPQSTSAFSTPGRTNPFLDNGGQSSGESFMGGLAGALPGILGVIMEAMKPPPAAPPPQAPTPAQAAVPSSNMAQLLSALVPGSQSNPYRIG